MANKFYICNLTKDQGKKLKRFVEENNLGRVNFNDIDIRVDYEKEVSKQAIIAWTKYNLVDKVLTTEEHLNGATAKFL